ncbi:CPBP family intramembrane glutamic endopeptidase [Halopiger xanaduensis]|uniref:Abortive infection protein n=1 Tax=Halopiger xanaduensis (strain DSM 18323 / JCM 14033 / SH-6) TaxID=797210 RepID=F8DBS3_HALXS|nr:CPBP family glutamic-type intramembrane protease [Halopiger xanaduensis]AEH38631.1 Abortive infection protein [Halopiger xanaduensis SH-6]
MADWAAFTGITGVVLVLLLVLSHLTQSTFSESEADSDTEPESDRDGADGFGADAISSSDGPAADRDPRDTGDDTGSLDAATDADEPDPGLLPDADAFESDADDTDAASRAGDPSRPSDERLSADERPNGGQQAGLENGSAYGRRHGHSHGPGDAIDPGNLSTGMLLANVALSQGLFALVLLGAVIYTGVPPDALGIEFSVAYLRQGLLLGTGAGLVLYVGNELGAAAATRLGFDHDEELRELLAPDSLAGWAVLLFGVLPIIAGFEELLFRAALIGAVSTGFGVSPWVLAVVSSLAFAVGHGMQGSVGVVVTGLLGFVLAAVFIVTGSFLVVVVAHYLINALEFAVHEGIDLEWTGGLER